MLKIIITIILLFPFLFSSAQSHSRDLTNIANSISLHEQNNSLINKTIKLRKTANPFKALLFLSLFVYQKSFSGQISASCEFDQSCSNFGIAAIQEFGIIKGVLLTADRLTRCNGQAQIEIEDYCFNHNTGKVIDEPFMYRWISKKRLSMIN